MKKRCLRPVGRYAAAVTILSFLAFGAIPSSVAADEPPSNPLPANLIVNPDFADGTAG
jgi:hypothetical protein